MCTMNNGLSLIKEIRVLSEGESVYNNNTSANEGANLLTLLITQDLMQIQLEVINSGMLIQL